jgi:hypothetical protein
LSSLSGLCGVRLSLEVCGEIYMVPKPRSDLKRLFDLSDVLPPSVLPKGRTNADTERKLTARRK